MHDQSAGVQKGIHYRFRQVKLLETALTHSSYANEQNQGRSPALDNNERLEFLGDAVLELTVSEELFKRFPHLREGELTRMRSKLVSEPALAEVARELQLDVHLLLGRGEEAQGGRERNSLLSDVLEALLGAIFLDGGFEAAQEWVRRIWKDRWPEGPGRVVSKDYKSRLQELTQQLFKDRPVYSLVDSVGPEHEKRFVVTATLPDGRELRAEGPSVKKAEQEAASRALRLLEREARESR